MDIHDMQAASGATLTTLERQNQILLTQNRWLKRLSIAVVAGAAVTICVGTTSFREVNAAAPKTVVAERFVLVDKAGKKRAVLGQEKAYGLTLLDEDETPRAVLFANKATGRGLNFMGNSDASKQQVGLAQLPDGSSVLLFTDEGGKGRVMLATAEKGKPVFVLSDENGKAVYSQP